MTYYNNTKEDNFSTFDLILSQTREEFYNNFKKYVINGNIIKEQGIDIIVTTINQENNDYYYLNFTKCEEILKYEYNIKDNEYIYLLRLDVDQEGMQVPSLYYELFYYNNTNNLKKLNLSFCKDEKIDVLKSVNLTGDINKYNPKSGYYKNICYKANSEYGTDIILSDRQNYFIDNNLAICEKDCDFISYNFETNKAVCSCDIKYEIPFMKELKFDKNLLKNAFVDINNFANLKMMKCYKTVFEKKNILNNYGFFIFAIIILLKLTCLFLFYFKDYVKVIQIIEKLQNKIINLNHNNSSIKNNDINLNKNKIQNKFKNEVIKDEQSSQRKISDIQIIRKNDKKLLFKEKKKPQKNNKKNKKDNPPKELQKKKEGNLNLKNINKNHFIKIQDDNNNHKQNENHIILNNNRKNNRRKKSITKNIIKKEIIDLNSSELNFLDYKEALLKDGRSYSQYYISLLKTKHILLFIFNTDDYNSRIIKLSIFLFNLSSSIAINALFFNDSSMHKIYIDKGSYNIIYQLPSIIYSSLISIALNFLEKLLGLSEKLILELKKKDFLKDINGKVQEIKKKLRIKFFIYFLFDFSLLFLFWFYITCFCGIYQNTQLHLIKDSSLSFTTNLLTPLVINLIPGILRITALQKKYEYLYKLSKLLQLI